MHVVVKHSLSFLPELAERRRKRRLCFDLFFRKPVSQLSVFRQPSSGTDLVILSSVTQTDVVISRDRIDHVDIYIQIFAELKTVADYRLNVLRSVGRFISVVFRKDLLFDVIS